MTYVSAKGYRWKCDGTADDVQINAAITYLGSLSIGSPGEVELSTGTFNIASSIVVGKKTSLIGNSGTALNVSGGTPTSGCVVVDPTNLLEANWRIENLSIYLNTVNTSGIYSLLCGNGNSMQGTPAIKHVRVYGVASGYAGVTLYNPFYMVVDGLNVHSNFGTGLQVRQRGGSYDVITGNSHFREIMITLNQNNAIGIDIESSTAKDSANLCQWDRVQVIGGTLYTGTTGVRIKNDCTYSVFNDIDLEGAATGLYMEDAAQCVFNGGLISGDDPSYQYGVRFVGTCSLIELNGLTMKGWSDETDGTRCLIANGGYFWGTRTATNSTRWNSVKGSDYTWVDEW